ncbi:MAG: deoxyribodipyrimidine photolyase [Prochlorococcus sp. SP3034]|nr:deoxyribodipyrimidine photolyase [Prochlorococcus sp. SP3034]|tara:strand:- start:22438 stop:23883 length:1446 start_codon:yes stop_codon:yes gene_type:complete
MGNPRILFWHRKDLRIYDNNALNKSFSLSKSITSIYVFDKNYTYDFNAESRAWFLGLSLKELSQNWVDRGSRLIIEEGDPILLIPQLAKAIRAEYVAWNKSIEPYEIKRDKEIKYILEGINIKVIEAWDNLLINPFQISTGDKKPYSVYGPFYKKFQTRLNQFFPIKDSRNAISLNSFIDLEKKYADIYNINSSNKKLYDFIKRNNFFGKNICPCIPGESGANKLLYEFFSSKKINSYDQIRNFPAEDGTSYLSASLRFGTISIRTIWEETEELKSKTTKKEYVLSIETWQKELIWREFYLHCLFHFPELEKGPYRKKWANFNWGNNKEWFMRWSNGDTGIPIIDASMRQLNSSGWMHNRCRMIVASFLVKDLICNWQMGEEKFMQCLVDGDLAANNGGWQWSASSGMDPKPLRIFNPYTQTQKFDPLCKYIKYWIPELKNVSHTNLIQGEISYLESNNYPSPIVNHNIQQRIFKTIYADI